MNVVNRAKNMILTPKTEWDVVAAEPTPPAQVVTGYSVAMPEQQFCRTMGPKMSAESG